MQSVYVGYFFLLCPSSHSMCWCLGIHPPYMQDDGVKFVSILTGASFYRRGRRLDYVLDYLPPTPSEFEKLYEPQRWFEIDDHLIGFQTVLGTRWAFHTCLCWWISQLCPVGAVLFRSYFMFNSNYKWYLWQLASLHNMWLKWMSPIFALLNTLFIYLIRWIEAVTSPVMLSTLESGKIVRGLAGIPSEGPVLYVGYHMMLGIELAPLVGRFWMERNILLRGIAHPLMFIKFKEGKLPALSAYDTNRMMGAVPVSASNFYKLFSSKSHILLFPGGMREALHRKVNKIQFGILLN